MSDRVDESMLDPKKRVKDFEEVALGYSEDEAVKEASRCLQCKDSPCIAGCPASIDIPKFISEIKEANADGALATIRAANNLPGVCGRVCPQETQCEKACVLAKAKKPIAIGKLEKYAADNGEKIKNVDAPKLKKSVALVGAGPASLSCAADLAKLGYQVTIYEALHKPGGVLYYGIPQFRLPRRIVEEEVKEIESLGVKIVYNVVIGKTVTIDQLKNEHDAIFIGAGAGLPNFMGIEGEDLNNVYSANEYLTRVNLLNAHEDKSETPIFVGKKVVVIGAGNVAMDAARTAKRLGSDVTIIYRRSFEDMPARAEEIEHAQEEGINFVMLTSPTKINGDGKVESLSLIQMMLGDEDLSGRRMPIPIEGTDFEFECDQVILAIGQNPNPLISKTSELKAGWKGNIMIDEDMRTSDEKIFAGGDIVSGSATVIKAVGDGKKAAQRIDDFIKGRTRKDEYA